MSEIRIQGIGGAPFRLSVVYGVWAGLFAVFFYYLTPFAWFPILVLAISGVASFVQILANMIGRKAESLKTIAQAKSGNF